MFCDLYRISGKQSSYSEIENDIFTRCCFKYICKCHSNRVSSSEISRKYNCERNHVEVFDE